MADSAHSLTRSFSSLAAWDQSWSCLPARLYLLPAGWRTSVLILNIPGETKECSHLSSLASYGRNCSGLLCGSGMVVDLSEGRDTQCLWSLQQDQGGVAEEGPVEVFVPDSGTRHISGRHCRVHATILLRNAQIENTLKGQALKLKRKTLYFFF